MAVRALVPLLGAAYSAQALSAEEAVVFWLALSVFSITGLLDVGFTPTFIRYFAYALAHSSTDVRSHPVGAVLGVQTRIYAFLTPGFFLVIGGVLAILLHPNAVPSELGDAVFCGCCILLGATATFYSAKPRAILQGAGQVLGQKRTEALSGFISLVGFLLLFSAPLSWVLALFAGSRGIELFLLTGQVRRLDLEKSGAGDDSTEGLWGEVIGAALRSGLGVLATGLVIEGTALFASKALAPEIAAQYMMSLRFVIMLAAFSNLPFQVAIPSLVRQFSLGERRSLISRVERLRSVVLGVLVLGAFALPAILVGMNRLLGMQVMPLELELWGLLVAYALLERGGAVNIQVQTLNKVVHWHKVNGLTGLAAAMLIIPLNGFFGEKGLALSFILAYGLVYFPYSVYLRLEVFGPPVPLWDRLLPISLMVVLFLLSLPKWAF